MKLIAKRIAIAPLAILSITSLVLVSACSGPGASADSITASGSLASSAGTEASVPAPTPTVVSNVPFPLDPAPTTPGPGDTANGSSASSGTVPNTDGRHHEGDHEGHEGGEGGELGEHRSVQRVAVTVTANGIQLTSSTVNAGQIEFDLSNQTAAPVDVLISGNGVNGDTGLIAPGATTHLQGTLPHGTYRIELGSSTPGSGADGATLQVQ